MATLKQHIYNVRNPNSGGRSHRALAASDRQIAFWIKEARNFLMYADARKQEYTPVGWEQDLGCVSLTKVDQADCPNKEWGETVKKIVIPRVLDLPNNGGITFFGLIDKRTRIYLPDTNYGHYDDFLPFKKSAFYEASQIGSTIYVVPSLNQNTVHNARAIEAVKKLCVVNVRVIAEDPTLINTCASDGVTITCFDEDTDCYPIPPHLEGAVYTYIDQHYINPKATYPEDTINDERKQTLI